MGVAKINFFGKLEQLYGENRLDGGDPSDRGAEGLRKIER